MRLNKSLIDGISAGLLILIGCTVYLSVENKIIGSLLFSIALFTICYKGYSLFTGKVGYLFNSKITWGEVSSTLLGNIIGLLIFGFIIRIGLPSLKEVSLSLVNIKLNQSYLEAFVRAIFCGMLMFIAVDGFKKYNQPLFIFLCVITFILCGFEHSIADIGYFILAGEFPILYIIIIIIGNSMGSWIIPILENLGEKFNG